MNVPTTKLLCWLSSAGFTFGLSTYSLTFFRDIDAKQKPFDTEYLQSVLNGTMDVEAKIQEGVNYEDVKSTFIKFNWTGKRIVEKGPEIVDTGPAAPTYTPVADLLTIQMIQVDTGAAENSRIFVNYIGGDITEEDGILKIEDALPSPHSTVFVEEIRADGVEFRFEGSGRENETVEPGSDADDGLIVVVGPDGVRVPVRRDIPLAADAGPFRPKETTAIGRNRFRVGTEDAQSFNENYSQILTRDVRSRTWHDPNTGRRSGIEIQEVRAGSIASRHGVQSGDIVISINGHPVTSKQDAVSYVKNNADNFAVWNVVIENMGKRRTVMYESPPD